MFLTTSDSKNKEAGFLEIVREKQCFRQLGSTQFRLKNTLTE